MFSGGEALGSVDTVMAAEEVAGDAGYGGEGSGFGAEELKGHEAARNGGVGGSGEDGYEAHCSEERGRKREDAGEGVAEGGSDEEERGDLSAFETGAEGEAGEGELGGEVVAGEMLGEGAKDGGDAEAYVLRGSDGEDGESYEDSADEGAEGWVGDVAFEEPGDGVGGAGEEECGEAEGDASGDGREHGGGVEGGLLGDGVDGVVDTPEMDGVVASEGGDEAGEDGIVAYAADGEDFEAEDGS